MGRYTFGFFVCCLSILADYFYHQYVGFEVGPFDRIVIDSICHQGIACLSTLTYFSLAHTSSSSLLTSSSSGISSSTLPLFAHSSGASALNSKNQLRNSEVRTKKRYLLLSILFGALVDLDHILSSQSWTIEGALHLSFRPIGHSVAFIFVVTIVLRLCCPCDTMIPVVYSLASLSHLIRDSSRRGLWFFLSLKTGPVTYLLHLALLCLLPYIVLYSSPLLERLFKTFSGAFSYCFATLCCQGGKHSLNSSSRNYYQYYRQIAQTRASALGSSHTVAEPPLTEAV